ARELEPTVTHCSGHQLVGAHHARSVTKPECSVAHSEQHIYTFDCEDAGTFFLIIVAHVLLSSMHTSQMKKSSSNQLWQWKPTVDAFDVPSLRFHTRVPVCSAE